MTLVCQCLTAATSAGDGGRLLCPCLGVHCVPVCTCVRVLLSGMYMCACKWVPTWLHETSGPVWGGGGRHCGQNAVGCWGELRGENVPHSSLPPRCEVVQPQPRPDQGVLAGRVVEVWG